MKHALMPTALMVGSCYADLARAVRRDIKRRRREFVVLHVRDHLPRVGRS